MAKRKNDNMLGTLLFISGSGLAVLAGTLTAGSPNLWVSSILMLLGIAVGVRNIQMTERVPFLFAIVSLVIMTTLGSAVLGRIEIIGPYIEGILLSVMTFVMPAGIIVALNQVYTLAEN